MVIGFDKIKIDGKDFNVEIVNSVPEGYNFAFEQKGYKVFKRMETIGDDTNCYYYMKL